MKKTYILDTSVIVHDPKCYNNLKNSIIYININCLNELDKLKSQMNEAGKQARVAVRYLDELLDGQDVETGIKLKNGSVLKIHMPKLDASIDNSYVDNQILQSLAELSKGKKTKPVLLTRDINLRVRAKALGLLAEGYEKTGKGKDDDLYTGICTIQSEELGGLLNEHDQLNVGMYDELKDVLPNQAIYFTDTNEDVIAIGIRSGDKINKLKSKKPWGIEARSREQAVAIDHCMNSKIDLTVLSGMAGSGKSLVALACALELVLVQKKFKKLKIFRPISSIPGQEIGYLPGTKSEKIEEYFGAIMDNFEVLLSVDGKKGKEWRRQLDLWIEKDLIEFSPLTFIRGANFVDQLVLFDEGQNISQFALKTLLSRISTGSKVILTGDLNQIDVKDLDINNCAMTSAINVFKNSDICSSVKFVKCERSKLAVLADTLL